MGIERSGPQDPCAERGPGDRQWAQQKSYRAVKGEGKKRRVGRSEEGQGGMKEGMEDNGNGKTGKGKLKKVERKWVGWEM